MEIDKLFKIKEELLNKKNLLERENESLYEKYQ